MHSHWSQVANHVQHMLPWFKHRHFVWGHFAHLLFHLTYIYLCKMADIVRTTSLAFLCSSIYINWCFYCYITKIQFEINNTSSIISDDMFLHFIKRYFWEEIISLIVLDSRNHTLLIQKSLDVKWLIQKILLSIYTK